MFKLFMATFFAACGAAGAQQVQLLETEVKESSAAPAQADDGMIKIIAPDEETPAAAPKQEAAAVPEVKVSTPTAVKGAVYRKGKAKAAKREVAVSTAAPSAQAAKPEAAAAAAQSASAVPAESKVPVQPEAVKAAEPVAAPAAPAEVKPKVQPEAAKAAALAPVPAIAPVPAAVRAPAKDAAESHKVAVSSAPAAHAAAPHRAARKAHKQPEAAPVVSAEPSAKPAAATHAGPAAHAAKKRPAAAARPAAVPAPAAGAGFTVGKRHTVAGGDTLWGLSGKYYNDPYKWGKIYNANMDKVSNPDRIYPKDDLLIPDVTEEVRPAKRGESRPAARPAAAKPVSEAEAVIKVTEFPEPPPQPQAQAAAPVTVAPAPDAGEFVQGFTPSDLSEEMPKDQKEWGHGVLVVRDNWREDGTISGKEKIGRDDTEDSFTLTGELIAIKMRPEVRAKIGDYLSLYMKGGDAYDKDGKRIGREVQAVGMAEVISVDGVSVKARVMDAVTPVVKGYVVKKR